MTSKLMLAHHFNTCEYCILVIILFSPLPLDCETAVFGGYLPEYRGILVFRCLSLHIVLRHLIGGEHGAFRPDDPIFIGPAGFITNLHHHEPSVSFHFVMDLSSVVLLFSFFLLSHSIAFLPYIAGDSEVIYVVISL